MKGTENFKKVIADKLKEMGEADPLFATTLAKGNKNIDDCITYILNAVQKSQCNAFADSEIFAMAVHYYDEDDIDIGNPIDCRVVVNHSAELTEDEKKQARKEAVMKEYERIFNKRL